MKYTVRVATEEDIQRILPYTTENAKVDWSVVKQSDELLVFCYGDEPQMVLGLVYYPTGTYITTAALWGLFRTSIDKHTPALVRLCKDLLFERVGFKFIAMVDANEKKFARFAEFFGFERTKELAELHGKVYHYYIKET